jgi:hypothetical protein
MYHAGWKESLPESCTRTKHVFSQSAHHTVRPSAILEDSDSSLDHVSNIFA